MSNIYTVFNTKTDYEFSNFLDKLDLDTNELLNITNIAESALLSDNDKRTKILEMMAGSADGNYELCVKQFGKKERVLKENASLNLNQIMELNNLVVNVSKKLQAPNCMKGLYNLIKIKTNNNVANTFIGMVQQSQINDSNLKFNTDLQVNGQNLAQIIYQLKNDIEMFINSIECPKKEKTEKKEEVTETVNELTPYNRIAGIYDINSNTFNELNKGEQHNMTFNDYQNGLIRYGIQDTERYGKVCYITAIDKGYAYQAMKKIKRRYPELNIDTFNLEFKTEDGSKMFVKLDSNGRQIFENKNVCNFTSEEVKQMIEEDKIRQAIPLEQSIASIKNWVQSVNKPQSLKTLIQMIEEHMAVAKNNVQANTLAHLKSIAQTKLNKLEQNSPKIEECIAQDVVSTACGEDTFNSLLNSLKPTVISITVNKEDGCVEEVPCETSCQSVEEVPCDSNYPEVVQPMEISPTAIDTPILRKPDTAMATSALTALSSHLGCVKSNSRENNIEELETINTLLGQLSNYFNSVLSESIQDNSAKEEYDYYVAHMNNISDAYDFIHSMYPNENMPLRQKLRQILLAVMISYESGTVDEIMSQWSQEPDNILLDCIPQDEQAQHFMKPAISILYNDAWEDDSYKALREIKDLYDVNGYDIEQNTINNIEDIDSEEDYWDGEDEEELEETCSAGATCAAGVSGFAKPLGSKPKKRKTPTVDVEMFKESVNNNMPCAIVLKTSNGFDTVTHRIFNNKGYLFVNEGLVKANTKESILEAFDDIYNECLELEILENWSPYQLDILMEEELNSNTIITPQEKQEQEQELDNEISANPNLKVGVTDNTSSEITDNQELIGVDDSDINNKQYVVRDPQTGKIKIANSTQIKVMEKQ